MTASEYLQMRRAVRGLANPQTRDEARRVLLERPAAALPALLAAVEGADSAQVAAAVELLGELGDGCAVLPLRRLLLHDTLPLATAAAEALGRLPSPLSVQALAEGLTHPEGTIRLEAALGLARLAASPPDDLAPVARDALACLDRADLPALCAALVWRLDPPARDAAFAAALALDGSLAVRALLAQIDGPQTAQSARDALRRPEAVPPLLEQLNRATASRIVPLLTDLAGEFRRPVEGGEAARRAVALDAILDALLALYTESNGVARAPLLAAFEAAGDRATALLRERLLAAQPAQRPLWVDLLTALRWSPTPDRAGALYAVAHDDWPRCVEIGAEAIEPLVEVFMGDDLGRRDAAARALDELGWLPPDIAAGWRYWLALGRWDEIAALGAPAVEPLVEALLVERNAARARTGADPRGPIRSAILRTLARLGAPGVTDALIQVLRHDPLPKVRLEALHTLERSGREGLSALARLLAEELEAADRQTDQTERRASLRADLLYALRRTRAPAALDLLARALARDPHAGVRAVARDMLLRHAPAAREAVTAALLPALDGPVTPELGETLRRLGAPLLERLLALIDCPDALSVNRATAGFHALARAGAEVTHVLQEPLLTGSARAREAAAALFDALHATPEHPDAQIAYWTAKGEIERCEAEGRGAIPALCAALPLYEWPTAGRIALALVRVGLPLDDPALRDTLKLLDDVAHWADEEVTQTLEVGRGEAGAGRPVTLRVSHQAQRVAAGRLLAEIRREGKAGYRV